MSKSFTTISPIDNSEFYTTNFNTQDEIDSAIKNSYQAYKQWSKTDLKARQDILSKFVSILLNDKEELALELTKMMGRPIRYTQGEIETLAKRAEYMISISEESLKPKVVEEKNGFKKYIKRVSLGPILLIAPWNYPYITSINGIIPALLAGNTVILKHSPQTPTVPKNYLIAFEKAGLPKNVFQFLHIDNEDITFTIQHPLIQFVNFTGSVENGKKVQKAANDKFMGIGLELGGKDPAYVREDADIKYTAENLVDGAMFNSGQSCCSVERIYVHTKVYQAFVEEFVKITKDYILGNPLDPKVTLGPMVSKQSAEFIRKQVKEAVSQGAKALIDENLFPNAKEGTNYVAPQVLINVNHNMSIMKDESFGPVVGIMEVRDDDEAIELMNDSEFGLTASIWTNDIDACNYVGEHVETGTIFMNRCDFPDPALAWTGVKNSGRGCTLSTLGFEPLTRPKSYHLKVKI
ncbi:aldehyde dehydrogenase [Neoconidiobolus thromboides FSU 785]|nr:aldehyde dehydrogenase [Neoconidiobolus thromboides FSU 785]